jgi:hypothetical protein
LSIYHFISLILPRVSVPFPHESMENWLEV